MRKRLFFWLVMMVALVLAPAARAEEELQLNPDGVTRLTVPVLNRYLEEGLANEGIGGRIKVVMVGDFPSTLYQSDQMFSPHIFFTRLSRDSQQFTADIVLKTKSGDGLGKPFTVEGRYEEWVSVPVLSSRMSNKQVIEAKDVVWQDVPQRRLEANAILDEVDLIGKSPRRVVSANRPVKSTDLVMPVVVRKGDKVTVAYKVGRIELKMVGEAMGDGAIGDQVAVKNVDSEKVIQAVVVSEGLMEAYANPASSGAMQGSGR